MKEDAHKINLEYLLQIMRNLYGYGMNEEDRRRILVFISRLINLKNAELRKQFIEELDEYDYEYKKFVEWYKAGEEFESILDSLRHYDALDCRISLAEYS